MPIIIGVVAVAIILAISSAVYFSRAGSKPAAVVSSSSAVPAQVHQPIGAPGSTGSTPSSGTP